MGDSGEKRALRRKRETDDACRRLAERVHAHGVRIDNRLAILDLLATEDDPDDLRDELETLSSDAERAARALLDRLRGS